MTIASLSTPLGQRVAIVACALIVLAAATVIWRSLAPSGAEAAAATRWFVCAKTGRAFRVTLSPGMSIPVRSPYSGEATGYEAELCFWTAEGKAKTTPTPVLLNGLLGKPGPTFCPDCGRRVVGHNPPPRPGVAPPLTRQEYTPDAP